MRDDSNSLSLTFMEGLYEDYLRDPAAVPPDWQAYFAGLSNGKSNGTAAHFATGPSFAPGSIFNPARGPGGAAGPSANGTNGQTAIPSQNAADSQHLVEMLIRNYRVRGHISAQLDPLGEPRPQPPELNPAYHGLTDADLDRVFATEIPGLRAAPLREIIARMQNTYCRSIGAQFMHIDDLEARRWLQERMEAAQNRVQLTRAEQLRILTRLTDATIFEQFIQKKFLGAKSFSLEGGESLIPLLDSAIEKAGEQGIEAIVLGMAHRGRLNVLANIMRKSPKRIFEEFEDKKAKGPRGHGDVKYHLGYSSDWITTSGGHIDLSLCFNPSHLEFVNPVALGRMRAKQDRVGPARKMRGMVMLIHGDAAFAGEGVIQETLNLSQLRGYAIGGTLHIVVNNQIGFTTGPIDARSSVYATDVAKMLQIPIFHVNGEDPEAVAQVVRLSMEFRSTFHRDVVIDMYCYRRRGHNETDEPAFTQPLLYQTIEKRKSVREGYLERLLQLGEVTREEADRIAEQRQENLEKELSAARSTEETPVASHNPAGIWSRFVGGPEPKKEPETGLAREKLVELLEKLTRVPEDFKPHPKLVRFLGDRKDMAAGKRPLDWAAGEALAFGALTVEGYPVRLTGQDSCRGTFTQRHAILHDVENGRTYMPLRYLAEKQAPIEIYDSALSEAGVMGFEYGYSLDYPDALVAWEAQFGDFVNAAQVIIDQFLTSSEGKWHRLSGLVLLLPHGFEGQGPEHSSARFERFLQLAAEDNIQVAYPSTPAQYFHLLRRQALWNWRKPLIVMTPKSLLRHERAVSSLEDCAAGRFQRVIGDSAVSPKKVKRILLCCGKIYYELSQRREQLKRDDVAIVRLEQLYPLRTDLLEAALKEYRPDAPALWVQEEPENMGAWYFLRVNLGEKLWDRHPLSCVARPVSASPATGSGRVHKQEQEELLKKAFGE